MLIGVLFALSALAQSDPLLDKQAQALDGLLKQYGDTSVETNANLWKEVAQNRRQFEKESKGARKSEQLALQQNFLKQLGDRRVSSLEQPLQLSATQVEGLRALLAEDFGRKLEILNNDTVSARRLEDVSKDTTRRLKTLLTPEQAGKYEALQRKAPSSHSPLWGAAPSTGDLPGAVEIAKGRTAAADQKKGEYLIAPIPIINPALGNGLAVATGYLFRADAASPPSVIGAAGFRTSNGSWGFGALQKLHLQKDLLRLTVGAGYLSVNYKFYGLGTESGNAGNFVPINQGGWGVVAEGLIHLRGKWYAGPRYVMVQSKISIDRAETEAGETPPSTEEPVIPAVDVNLRTAGLGPHIQRDSRDDEIYARAGSLFNTQIGFRDKVFGGRRSYQSYQLSFSKYISLGRRQVLAVRGSSCFTAGSAPFYDLCGFQAKDVRGYAAGRYLDRDMLASQAEFRQELPKRLGFVLFAGAGGVAPKLSEFKFKELRPGGGVGLRFRVTKQNHVNITADYAFGIGSRAFYVSVGEVF